MAKSYEEINDKIRRGKAVVLTAEEMVEVVKDRGVQAAAREVDVVTTGTFGPMCSSGALLNVGHTTPRMKIQRATLNGVEAYGGLAAVDLYVGATQVRDGDPLNDQFPGRFEYGGGHVIEALVRGEAVELAATAYGTDCYPRRELKATLRLADCKDATLLNPRNAYQNYNVAVNVHGARELYTYLGVLRPGLGNATFCSAGQLSPLLKDPHYRTIGIGTRIFLGGGVGYVAFAGTQHNPGVARTDGGVPTGGAGTLMLVGDLKAMRADYLRGVSMVGYGTSLSVGIGVPIPILDEDLARATGVPDAEILAPVIDYSRDYPENHPTPLAFVSYAQLRAGAIEVGGRAVPAVSLSSYAKARAIALALKGWIAAGRFALTRPVAPLPGAHAEEGGAS
jgi:uncharacterized protein (DUF39 family)